MFGHTLKEKSFRRFVRLVFYGILFIVITSVFVCSIYVVRSFLLLNQVAQPPADRLVAIRTEPELPPAPEVLPGDRPKFIRSARFFTIEDFVMARKNAELTDGEWVCVEGRVNSAGERFGAKYLTLQQLNDDPVVWSFEGEGLRSYQINRNMNVVLLGQCHHGYVAKALLIPQWEVFLAHDAEQKKIGE